MSFVLKSSVLSCALLPADERLLRANLALTRRSFPAPTTSGIRAALSRYLGFGCDVEGCDR